MRFVPYSLGICSCPHVSHSKCMVLSASSAWRLQARGSLEDTKKRISESERRIDEKLPQFVSKKYW